MKLLRGYLFFLLVNAIASQTTTLETLNSLETTTNSAEEETATGSNDALIATMDYRCTPQFQLKRPVPIMERFIHKDCMLVEFAGYIEMRRGDGGFIELKNGRLIRQTECRYSINNSIMNIRFDNCAEIGIMFKDEGDKGSYVQNIRFGYWQEDDLRNNYMLVPGEGMKTPSRNDHYRCDSEQAIGDFPSYDFFLHLSQVQFEVFRNSSSPEFTTTPHVCRQDFDKWW